MASPSLLDKKYLARSITQLASDSLAGLLRLLEEKHPGSVVTSSSEEWQIDVGALSDAAFRDVEELVCKELNDDDYLGRSRHEREAAESIAAIVRAKPPPPARASASAAPSPKTSVDGEHDNDNSDQDDDDDGGEERGSGTKKRERRGFALILRDNLKDKNFEFHGVPCVLLSSSIDTNKPWVCKYQDCNKTFVSKDKQVRHSLTHTGDKPFACQVCSRGFNDTANLHNHLRTQHYICHSCLLQCDTRADIDAHFTTVHASKRLRLTKKGRG